MTLDDNIDELIAYVEGQLPPDRRAAFEAKLAGSPELQRQLQLLRQADDAILHQFAPPAFLKVDFQTAQAAASARAAQPPSGLPWKRWTKLVGSAIAASIVLVLAYTWLNDNYLNPKHPPLTLGQLYSNYVANGFQPAWACKDDAEFVKTTTEAFGLPLLARSDASVQIVGWTSYGDKLTDLGVSRSARGILARVNNHPVMVIIDKVGAGSAPKLDRLARKNGLKLFQKQIDSTVLYEITPLDAPAAIEKFFVDRPPG